MVGHRGAPGGSDPMPWGKYLLALIGIPVRTPKIWDEPERKPPT